VKREGGERKEKKREVWGVDVHPVISKRLIDRKKKDQKKREKKGGALPFIFKKKRLARQD